VKSEVSATVVGGAGHVGLPLAVMLAARGVQTLIFDINAESVNLINAGKSPFYEPGLQSVLEETRNADMVRATTSRSEIGSTEFVIVVVGTPV